MKLSSITIKGMHKVRNKTYDLTGFRYFYGENGAGKSTVMQAIQLALLGYIPGTDKNKSAIFKHSSAPEMLIHLNIDDNGNVINITRRWYKKGKDIAMEFNVEPEIYDLKEIVGSMELPVFNFSEFINMSANKLKDWFISFLPATDKELNWDMLLSDAVSDFGRILDTEFYSETVEYIKKKSQTIHGVQLVREFNAYLKEQQSYYKAELTRMQNTVQSLIYYSDCDNSQGIDGLKSDIQAMQFNIENLNTKLLKIQQNERILAELETVRNIITASSVQEDEKYIAAVKVKSDGEKQLEEYGKNLTILNAKRADVRAGYAEKKKVVDSNGNCPYICTECSAIKNMIYTFKQDMVKLESELTGLNNQINSTERDMEEIKRSISLAAEEVAHISNAYLKYETLSKQINREVSGIDIESVISEINALKSKVQQYNDSLIKLEANKKYDELTENLTNEKYKAEQNIELLKVWIKLTDVNGLQSQIMETPFKQLEKNMSEYLQKFFAGKFRVAKFHLSEKANSFSFGVLDNDSNYIEFDLMSSGEKCLYTLALLISIVESSDSQLKLVMIDDLLDHLDMARIKDCFETLYTISGVQILLAGVQQCSHSKAEEFVIKVTGD